MSFLLKHIVYFLLANALFGIITPIAAANWYEDVRDISIDLFKQYPPGEYHYVIIGRSPTPFAMFFENLGLASVSQIPLSGMRRIEYPDSPNFTPKMRKRLHKHLDKYFPSEHRLNGRKVLVLDYSSGSDGFDRTIKHIHDYMQSRGRSKTELKSHALLVDSILGDRYARLRSEGHTVHKLVGDLGIAFERSYFDKASPVGQWYIDPNTKGEDPSNPIKQVELQNSITEQMKNDIELRAFLRSDASPVGASVLDQLTLQGFDVKCVAFFRRILQLATPRR